MAVWNRRTGGTFPSIDVLSQAVPLILPASVQPDARIAQIRNAWVTMIPKHWRGVIILRPAIVCVCGEVGLIKEARM